MNEKMVILMVMFWNAQVKHRTKELNALYDALKTGLLPSLVSHAVNMFLYRKEIS